MKLMYPEVDIVPGRAGQRPTVTPVREEQPLPGSSVIRLNNPTTQENAFTIRVRSEEKFWQEAWYTIVALPPGQGAENAPPPGKPDQRGPQDRWVKIYVPRGGSRDVLIRFNVPPRPESRAGKYKYFVEVETQIIGPTEGGRRKEHVAQVPGVAVVRPYYKWSVDLSPEERNVGRRDRSADFEVVVTNEGNDWLYCDMQLPRPKDMQLDSPTLRLAVPPPEPGTLPPLPGSAEVRPGTQRTIPLSAVTKLKVFRGEITRQPIQLSAQRVDAPSVPPPASDGYAGLGAVIAAPTTEKAQVGDRALIYRPPVPAKFTDFFTRGATSIRTMAFGLIGIAAAAVVSVYMYQVAFFQGVKVEPNSLSAQPGGTLLVTGQFLQGCKLYMGTKGNYVEVPYRLDPFHATRVTITKVPEELNHHTNVKVMAQRFVWILPFLTPVLPHAESKSLIQVGSLIVQQGPPSVDPVNPGPFKPGDHVTVTGKNLGTSGAVVVNGLKVTNVVAWTPEKIVFAAPQAAPGATLPVKIVPEGGTGLDATSYQIAALPPVTPPVHGKPPVTPPVHGKPPVTPPVHGKPPVTPPVHGKPPVTPPVHGKPKVIVRPAVLLGAAPYDLIMAGGDNSYNKAIGAAEDRVKINHNDAESLALEAYAWVKSGHAERARPLVARALASAPPNSRARAYALVAQGTLADAEGKSKDKATLDIFTAAGNVNETFGLPYIAYADHLVKVKQTDFAKALLTEGLSKVTSPSEKSAIQQKLSSL